MSFPGVLRVTATVMTATWNLHLQTVAQQVWTGVYQQQHRFLSTELSRILLACCKTTGHSCLFGHFAYLIPHIMLTWGAWELCETSNPFLHFSYHSNSFYCTERGRHLTGRHQINETIKTKYTTQREETKNNKEQPKNPNQAMEANTTQLQLHNVNPLDEFFITY